MTTETMCLRWADVLGLPSVDPDEDFFDLGGQSILAARLARALSDELDLRVAVVDILDHPTANELTAMIAHRRSGGH